MTNKIIPILPNIIELGGKVKNERLTALSAVENSTRSLLLAHVCLRSTAWLSPRSLREPMLTAQAHTRPAQTHAHRRRPKPRPTGLGSSPCGWLGSVGSVQQSVLVRTRVPACNAALVPQRLEGGFTHKERLPLWSYGISCEKFCKITSKLPVLGCVDFELAKKETADPTYLWIGLMERISQTFCLIEWIRRS